MNELPRLEELNYLYGALSEEERDELLQSLLVSASHGGQAVIETLQAVLFIKAGEQLIESMEDRPRQS